MDIILLPFHVFLIPLCWVNINPTTGKVAPICTETHQAEVLHPDHSSCSVCLNFSFGITRIRLSCEGPSLNMFTCRVGKGAGDFSPATWGFLGVSTGDKQLLTPGKNTRFTPKDLYFGNTCSIWNTFFARYLHHFGAWTWNVHSFLLRFDLEFHDFHVCRALAAASSQHLYFARSCLQHSCTEIYYL